MKRTILWILDFLLIISIGLIPYLLPNKLIWVIAPISGVIILRFVSYYNYQADKLKQIWGLLDILYRILEFDSSFEVRCTLHKPRKKTYKQLLNYIPTHTGKNRVFDANKGLVGKCIERKKLVIESFKSAEDFREKMINSYNYTVNEMKDRSPERRSYLCYPLIDSNSAVKGVIFFDAVKPNVFSANEDKHENQLIRKVARKIYDIYFD